jgi:hypothetical protein
VKSSSIDGRSVRDLAAERTDVLDGVADVKGDSGGLPFEARWGAVQPSLHVHVRALGGGSRLRVLTRALVL